MADIEIYTKCLKTTKSVALRNTMIMFISGICLALSAASMSHVPNLELDKKKIYDTCHNGLTRIEGILLRIFLLYEVLRSLLVQYFQYMQQLEYVHVSNVPTSHNVEYRTAVRNALDPTV